MNEAERTAQIKKALKEYEPDLVFWKQHQGGYGIAGVSDIIGCCDGVFFALEVKVPGRPATKAWTHQRRFLEKVRAAGGRAAVVTSAEEAVAAAVYGEGKAFDPIELP